MSKVCESPFCTVKFDPRTPNQKYHNQQCKRDVENVSRRRRVSIKGLAEEAELIRLPEDDDPEMRIAYLQEQNRKLARENATLKNSKRELADSVFWAVRESLRDKQFDAIAKPVRDKRKKQEEHVIANFSDWQLGKRTATYSAEACAKALELYTEKFLRITDIQRADHPVSNAHVWMLGDMVEGEEIFPGQAHHIDLSLYQQLSLGPQMTVRFLRTLLKDFDSIHFVGVPGNHGMVGGRSRHDMHPETNADRMFYNTVRMILENEPRITWDIPDGGHEGEDFYAIDTIGDKKYLLFHGHQCGGGYSGNVPVSGIKNKITGWRLGAIKEPFDYAFLGHYHNPTKLTFNDIEVWVNGTMESSNGWAVEKIAATGRPMQYMFFAHPEHGITAEYPLRLDLDV